jgi:hypothetical protein
MSTLEVIAEILLLIFSLLLFTFVVNQRQGYWLLFDALLATIEICVKFNEEKTTFKVELSMASG